MARQQNIGPTDPKVEYVGRWAHTSDSARAQWTASELRFSVRGTNLSVDLEDEGKDWWEARVDGKVQKVWQLEAGRHSYSINWPDTGSVADVELQKRTEPFLGITTFLGASTEGSFAKPPRAKRLLEFVGDSITCGFGDEGKSQDEPFKPDTENGTETYAMLAARQFHADATVLAWSGRKMWPDNTVPEIYDLILPTQANSIYDFKGPKPDAVIINLATNDFGRENPDAKGWITAYGNFIHRLRGHYPAATIYCVAGGMMSDDYPQGHHALSTLRADLAQLITTLGDSKVHELDFDTQRMEDGIGSAWHPNLVTHGKMAAKLEEALKRDLHW